MEEGNNASRLSLSAQILDLLKKKKNVLQLNLPLFDKIAEFLKF